jgi:hypothetical protein
MTYLGMHDSAEDAARAYDASARQLGWPAARLNFPYEAGAHAPS